MVVFRIKKRLQFIYKVVDSGDCTDQKDGDKKDVKPSSHLLNNWN